jgi:hypothetical protein
MDMRDQIVGDQPDDIFHKIASIIPGYHGYMDRERRRDADKLLRTQLAHKFAQQRDRLNRVQQTLLRTNRLENIAEVDRLAGLLQRFLDKLNTASYGYRGLFDPVKIESRDLDQLYAFDMALTSGVDQVSSAIDALEAAGSSAGQQEMPAAIDRLSSVLDDLNTRLSQRSDLLTSGDRLSDNDYRALVGGFNQPPPTPAQGQPGSFGAATGAATGTSGAGGAPTQSVGSNPGAGTSAGTPTTNIGVTPNKPPDPGLSSLIDDNQGFTGESSAVSMGSKGPGQMSVGGEAGTGIETASSPAAAPGAPGHDIVEGLDMASDMGSPVASDDMSGNLNTLGDQDQNKL